MQRTEVRPRLAVELVAPAKINLALHVTGRRADGYHLLESLVVFSRDGDGLSVSGSTSDSFRISGPFARDLPDDGSNLVIRARDLLRARHPRLATPVAIELEKALPPASGLGGGSSDAAATLRALASIWGVEQPDGAAALCLGADLPMCLAARPLIARGIGEQIEPLDHFPALDIVLVNPGMPVSTPEVFSRLARRENAGIVGRPRVDDLQGLVGWLDALRNDLEEAAIGICPAIGDALAQIEKQGALLARMTGSGATCFGIFRDEQAACAAAERISALQPLWYVRATQTLPAAQGGDDARP